MLMHAYTALTLSHCSCFSTSFNTVYTVTGCVIIFLTMFLSLLIKAGVSDSTDSDNSDDVYSILLILLNLAIVVTAIVQLATAGTQTVGSFNVQSAWQSTKRFSMKNPMLRLRRSTNNNEDHDSQDDNDSVNSKDSVMNDNTKVPVRALQHNTNFSTLTAEASVDTEYTVDDNNSIRANIA
jgi:hypothetical protein